MATKISGILKDGMGRPIPKCTIELKSKKTSLTVIVETEAREGLNNTGAYSLNVEPGKYAVTLNIYGFPPKRVGEINVYPDSPPGTLNEFLMLPGESDLTPELVLIFQQLRDEAKQAASEAKADRELVDSILTDVITVQADVNEKQLLVNADMIEAGKSKTAAAASAKAASEDAGKTAADVATVAGLKASAETAAQQAELSNVSASGHAGRAEVAANSVKTLTATGKTLPPGTPTSAVWDAETNTLTIGVPQGIQGIKGDKGEQGDQGLRGVQGIQGIKGDVGPVGPSMTLSPLLTSISRLTTEQDQLIYSSDVNTVRTTPFTTFGRSWASARDAYVARNYLALGTAAMKNVGTALGDVMEVGVSGGPQGSYRFFSAYKASSNVDWNTLSLGLYPMGLSYSGLNSPAFASVGSGYYGLTYGEIEEQYKTQFAIPKGLINYNAGFGFRCLGYNGWMDWVEVLTTVNTTVDANGFIKKASPIVKLFTDGSCELNQASEGVTTERLSEGVYRLSGSLMGFNADRLWDVVVPADDNKQPLIWVKSIVEADGDIIVNTYHRTHPNAPQFAQNVIEDYNDGDPIDIPAGRWVDLRVQVYTEELQIPV